MSEDLVAFLRARLDEDEQAAKATTLDLYAARVLADVDSKRRIVAMFEAAMTRSPSPQQMKDLYRVSGTSRIVALAQVLQTLALPHRGHRDYDERWRP